MDEARAMPRQLVGRRHRRMNGRSQVGWVALQLKDGPPNGPTVKPRGQGPRPEAEAARRVPACESRNAGGVTQRGF